MVSSEIKKKLADKLTALPADPGAYLFKDKNGKVIYVGKAKVLRNRVRSYFNKGEDGRYQYNHLVNAIDDLEVIITGTEIEALILEASLIKEHIPRFNVRLRDDKSYPYVRITKELFPQVFVTRKTPRDGSKYLGPYTDVKGLRRFMRTFKGLLRIRNCNRVINQELINSGKYRPCLNFHIGRCAGACSGKISSQEYQQNVQYLMQLLQGRDDELKSDLEKRMLAAAEQELFEEAAQWRDRLKHVESFSRQTVVSGLEAPDLNDRDVIALAAEDDDACAALFQIRHGRIVGRSHFYLTQVFEKTSADVLSAFVREYYQRAQSIPEEIFLPVELEDAAVFGQWLTEKRDKKVTVAIPKIGDKAKLMRLVQANADMLLAELKLQKSKKDFVHHAVKALQRDLLLTKLPKQIEAFDISNIQGTDTVASMVCFKDAKPAKSEYRRFKINTVTGADDVASMGEAVARRYKRVLREKRPLPDLILIDGGKGQLNRVVSVLTDLGIDKTPVIGLAKKLEEVFVPGESLPLNIPKNSSGLKLLCQVRDEAHRFAITYHRSLRTKRTLTGELDAIPGVGESRKKALLKHFGSLKKLKEASVDQISAVQGISRNLAEGIYGKLRETAPKE
ncbi:excinuclease ABC subunit UvrC [bacterium]|nr:excinuclease ABC subunit UvrC [bacterium]MBU1882433.1 excinuclease ABC subunit UvrC [bacterium]